jgi:chromosomal replication initiation ATPase DnaA
MTYPHIATPVKHELPDWDVPRTVWELTEHEAAVIRAMRAADPTGRVAMIQRHVAAHFGIALIDMRSSRRARAVARPRQVAMYLARHLTEHSLPELGRYFGNRDHTTVMLAIRRVEQLCREDWVLAHRVAMLRQRIEHPEQFAMAV